LHTNIGLGLGPEMGLDISLTISTTVVIYFKPEMLYIAFCLIPKICRHGGLGTEMF
jgi:hypothetical protein